MILDVLQKYDYWGHNQIEEVLLQYFFLLYQHIFHLSHKFHYYFEILLRLEMGKSLITFEHLPTQDTVYVVLHYLV